MDCSETRRQLLCAPEQAWRDLEDHLLKCRQCAAFASSLLRLEAQLDDATAVPVPDGLSARVLLHATLT